MRAHLRCHQARSCEYDARWHSMPKHTSDECFAQTPYFGTHISHPLSELNAHLKAANIAMNLAFVSHHRTCVLVDYEVEVARLLVENERALVLVCALFAAKQDPRVLHSFVFTFFLNCASGGMQLLSLRPAPCDQLATLCVRHGLLTRLPTSALTCHRTRTQRRRCIRTTNRAELGAIAAAAVGQSARRAGGTMPHVDQRHRTLRQVPQRHPPPLLPTRPVPLLKQTSTYKRAKRRRRLAKGLTR